jgi:nucleotide-binding universal stress UspA family protein
MYKQILIPTDGTEFAEKAIATAIGLAKAVKANLVAVTVTQPFTVVAVEGVLITQTPDDYNRWSKELAEKRLRPIQAAAEKAGVACKPVHVESYQPYEGIIQAAKDAGADVIVMASHGRRGVSAMLLGSETQKVLTHSTVPVLVVR